MNMDIKYTRKNKKLKFQDIKIGQVFYDEDEDGEECYYIKIDPNMDHGLKSNVVCITTMSAGAIDDDEDGFIVVDAELIINN